MPYITTTTNTKISDEKREIIKSKYGTALGILGKTESWLMLSLLGISPDMIYVKFNGCSQWGWNNMTF